MHDEDTDHTSLTGAEEEEDDSLFGAMMGLMRHHGSAPPSEIGEKEGDLIDGYELLELLGSGGMGEVWRAEKKEPVVQQVAMKIVKLGMDTKTVVARFEAERRLLALMEHPNIARITDGGATESGRPYFVMELVTGRPITDYAQAAALTLRARLELCIQACLAVEHAHRKGIIHRDLKPGNMLVADVNGEPFLKIIDFGIAKATLDTDMAQTLVTAPGQVLGTLGYMSPEQTAFDHSGVDTRSDIYSLGAILYELVTENLPLNTKSLSKEGQDEALRMIRQDMPQRPSTRIQSFEALQASEFVRKRGLYRTELDSVILKALDKDPDRRYASASAFADDLRNLLENRPVLARPNSLAYTTRKWVERRRALVNTTLAAGSILVLSVLGLVSMNRAELREAEDQSWVQRLIEASPAEVPTILDEREKLSPSILRTLETHDDLTTSHGLHAAIARLHHGEKPDPVLSERLLERMLEADDVAEFTLMRKTLGLYVQTEKERLWEIVTNDLLRENRRFRAAVALAGDPVYREEEDAERWHLYSLDIAEWLTSQPSVTVAQWLAHLEPRADSLLGPLETELFHRSSGVVDQNAALVLSILLAPDISGLVRLVRVAKGNQIASLTDALRPYGNLAIAALDHVLQESFKTGETQEEKDRLALEQARAGIALMLLEAADRVEPHLQHSRKNEDPRKRTFLIHHFAAYDVEISRIAPLLNTKTTERSVILAALLALGEYPKSVRQIEQLWPVVADLFTTHPDSGVHGGAEWLLNHWIRTSPDLDLELPKLSIDREIPSDRDWSFMELGITMTIIRDPEDFVMGLPTDAPAFTILEHHKAKQRHHWRRIPRSFAISTTPITFEAYEQYEPCYREQAIYENRFSESNRDHLNDTTPVQRTGYDAAIRYCNWLSWKMGIPKDQYCYELSDKTGRLEPKINFLSLGGFRLPTDGEWEYACRAGSNAFRPYGYTDSILSKYAWYRDNSDEHSWPTAMLRPNDFGLYDMLGNVVEWVEGHYQIDFPTINSGVLLDIEKEIMRKPKDDGDVLNLVGRGRSYLQGAFFQHPGTRLQTSRNLRLKAGHSFRIARTVPEP